MRSLAPRLIGSIDLTPINEAISQTLIQAQHLNQPVILTYGWNYAEFNQGQSGLEPITPASLLENVPDSEYKFYWQHQPLTLAAIGVVVSINPDPDNYNLGNDLNQNRFETAKLFCKKYLTHTLNKGETALGLIPTYALGGFAFHDQALDFGESWQGFPNKMLFIPQWLLLQEHDSPLVITLSYYIYPDDNLSELERSVAELILKFPDLAPEPSSYKEFNPNAEQDIEEVTGDRPWTEIVEQSVQLIKWGKLEKIVLARALDVNLTCSDLEVLSSLRHNYPDCISFLLNFGVGSFVGATPEILLQFQMNDLGDSLHSVLQLKSDAIAGSTRRGLSTSEDQLLGSILLASLKDRYEHEIVIRSICDRLKEFKVELQNLTLPKLKPLKNVQHLHTEIKGIIKNGHWLQSFDILRQLHPTAAVGGEPQEIAVQLIQESEACDRGWYAAPIGWVNSNGEGIFAVGIRSGYLNNDSARIYAGAGIVSDSDIASELGETAIKFEALLRALS